MSLALAALLSGAPVFRPGPPESARFRDAYGLALRHYRDLDLGAAVANFRSADRLHATPEVAYDLAKCHERLGDVAFATYYYRLYLRRAPEASDALEVAGWVGRALAAAENEGKGYLELDARLASSLEVAGLRFPDGPVALFLLPGEYEVSGDFGGERRRMSTQVKAGRASSHAFEPVPAPLVPTERALSEALIARGEDRPRDPLPLRVGGGVVAGAGLAAVAAGVALSLLASQDAALLRAGSGLTAAQTLALADQGASRATAAGAALGAGGAAVVGGLLLFVLSLGEVD